MKLNLMNSRFVFIFLLSISLLNCKPYNASSLDIEISNNEIVNKIEIRNFENDNALIDSATVSDKSHKFFIDLQVETLLKVRTNDYNLSELLFFYEPQFNYTLQIQNSDAVIKAPEKSLQYEFNQLLLQLKPLNEKLSEISKDTVLSNHQLHSLSTKYFNELLDFQKAYISENPKSHVSLYLVHDMVRLDVLSFHELTTYYNVVNNQAHKGKGMLSFIDEKFKTLSENRIVGESAPNFNLKSNEGVLHTLDDFVGNYTLIDFWASWCAPCRVSNKKMIALYNKYKEKGLNIISISFDDNKESWQRAIKEDQITWTQLSDLQGFDKSEVKGLYNVQRLPTIYVISPEGKVVDQQLTQSELEELLERVYK